MSTQPTIREMQNAIMTVRRFADQDDYGLCRSHLKDMVKAIADLLEAIISARDWVLIDDERRKDDESIGPYRDTTTIRSKPSGSL